MSTFARRAARTGRFFRELLLTVAALGGAACIVLVVLAFMGGYSLMMFKTGSMTPTIPAGSVALVQELPAADIAVGDIITVDRPGTLPITHRVTTVTDGPTSDQRVITMRGDANDVDDPLPYTISDARIVRGSVPHLAHVIVWFGNPWVLGGIAIGASILVTWAFWPREPKAARPVAPADSVAPADDHNQDHDRDRDRDRPEPQTRRERRLAGLVCIGILLGAGVTGIGTATPAEAASSALTMTSDIVGTGPQTLDAVEPFYWHVDVDATAAPGTGDLTVELAGSGDAAFDLSVEVTACARPWQNGICPEGEQILRPASLVSLDGSWGGLLRTTTPAVSHLRLALTAATTDASSASGSLTVRATAQGASVEESMTGAGELAQTGGQSWSVFAAPAAVLLGLGVALSVGARRRRDPHAGGAA